MIGMLIITRALHRSLPTLVIAVAILAGLSLRQSADPLNTRSADGGSTQPSLPSDIAGRALLSQTPSGSLVGTLASPAAWIVADGETVLALDETFAVTSVESQPNALRVRALMTGTPLETLEVDGRVDAAAIRSGRIYWSGVSAGQMDHGLSTATIGEVPIATVLIEPSPDRLPDAVIRGPIRISPSGDRVGSSLCSYTRCLTHVVDSGSGDVRLLDSDGGLYLLADDAALTINGSEISAMSDVGQIWKLRTTGTFLSGYLTSDGSSLIQGSTEVVRGELRYEIARISIATGDRTLIATWPETEATRHLMPDLSSDAHAVLMTGFVSSEAALADSTFDVMDVTSGTVLPTSFTLAAGEGG